MIGLHTGPETLEFAHHVREVFPQIGDHGGPSHIVCGPRPASREPALGGIGPNKPVKLLVDMLSQLEEMIEVRVQSGAELFHVLCVLGNLDLFIGFLDLEVQLFDADHILLHVFDFFGEHLQAIGVATLPHLHVLCICMAISRIHVDLEGTIECTIVSVHFSIVPLILQEMCCYVLCLWTSRRFLEDLGEEKIWVSGSRRFLLSR